MKIVAIITARGGSKRIPQKNIKDFLGKPIIAYSIEAAVESGVFDEVMVSTDSEEIASVAIKYGASVPFMRSDKTSNDYATTADVIEEVIGDYKKAGKEYDSFACIYPTAPFITRIKLKNAFKLFEDENADSVISVVKYDFPPQRAFVVRDQSLRYLQPEHEKTRSQDLEPVYHDCGQFYFAKTGEFLKKMSFVLPHTLPFVISPEEVQDIDTLDDWKLAEFKVEYLKMRTM